MAAPVGNSAHMSATSSLSSSHEFSVSRVLSNGNGGVVSSVIWLTISTALCFPWLLEQPSEAKAEEAPKSVAWFLVMALDLLIGTMSIFSLWFQRSTLSIMLLIWGASGIVATFLVGSFAMLPAVATICCCAEEFCVMGAADITALDDNFCHANLDLCMETEWSLWSFYGGILLAMVSIVLLVNSVALHHKTLLDCERRREEAAKALRVANRSRRRRQELWEQEVYGGGSYMGSNFGARESSCRTNSIHPTINHANACATPFSAGRPVSRISAVAPSFESPTRSDSRRISRSTPTPGVTNCNGAHTSTPLDVIIDRNDNGNSNSADIEMSRLESPTSAPMSQSGQDEGCGLVGGDFSIGAYTGGSARFRDGGSFYGGGRGDESLHDDATRISAWGKLDGPANTGAAMSWVASDDDGAGTITPKTALRFKTSALSRAMHR